jgi:hypothetical protein
MVRKVVAAGALVCVLMPMSSGTASAGKVVPWNTVARSANVVCLDYNKKLFKLPGILALQKVKSEKDLTPEIMKQSMVPFLTGELAIQKEMVRKWSALGTPKEPRYRVAWARWLTLWKTVHIPGSERMLASAKRYDLKGMAAAEASITAHDAEGNKLEKQTLAFAVCQWGSA